MHQHGGKKTEAAGIPRLVLVGNANVGKSVIFQLLTGQYATVSNYPGTTVELSYGISKLHHEKHMVIDTPGVCNLVPYSEDEKVTRDILLNEEVEAVIQVGDAKNLVRSLFITLQLVEMGMPMILILNMMDEAMVKGIYIDISELEHRLEVPVVDMIATEKVGLPKLKNALSKPGRSPHLFSYGDVIEKSIREIEGLLPAGNISKRSIAISLLSGDVSLETWLINQGQKNESDKIKRVVKRTQQLFKEPLSYVINQIRIQDVHRLLKGIFKKGQEKGGEFSKKLGNLCMHSIWGLPILVAVLYLTYQFVGNFGAQYLVGFFEKTVFEGWINPFLIEWVPKIIPIAVVSDFLVGEYGMFTMALKYALALVLPIVGTFFIAFGILEDSGYMPRLAVMLNRAFKVMGLNGKAVLPMLLGLGCDTMATMTARILDTKKERLIVILLLALAVPCSAQLGVILGMFGGQPAWTVFTWAGSVIFILLAVGYLAAKILPGDASDFILEIPPLRL
ncbi:MAG: ferrous iron transport protein B, partial [bacterium]